LTHSHFARRFRTAINVLGDSIGAGLVYHLSKDELSELDALGRRPSQAPGSGFEAVPMRDLDEADNASGAKKTAV